MSTTAEPFISAERTSEITGLTLNHLAQLRYRGQGPRFYKPTPRVVRYRESDVIAWIEASAQTITGQDAA